MKALNVFGIILAWILSIAMVLMLIVAPLALSVLSVLEPENIVQIISGALVENIKPTAAQPQEKIVLQNLSAETDMVVEEPAAPNAAGSLEDGIRGLLGDDVSEEVVEKVLSSDTVEELLGAYTRDFTNAVAGKDAEKEFTPEFLVEVVKDNLDEIVEIAEESGEVTFSAEQKEQLKSQISTAVEEQAEEIVAAIPVPEELKESLIDGNKELEFAFTILANKNKLKGTIVGAIVLISVLIFAFRYPGLRGMRWLSTNLFTAGGFNVLICVVLGLATSTVKGVTAGINALDGTEVEGVVGTLLSLLSKGMVIRTAIIFVAAIALLVSYILLKPFARKKKAAKAEEVIPELVAVERDMLTEAVPQEEIAEIQETVAEEPAEEPAPAEEI